MQQKVVLLPGKIEIIHSPGKIAPRTLLQDLYQCIYQPAFNCPLPRSLARNPVERQRHLESGIGVFGNRRQNVLPSRVERVLTVLTLRIEHIELPACDGSYQMNGACIVHKKRAGAAFSVLQKVLPDCPAKRLTHLFNYIPGDTDKLNRVGRNVSVRSAARAAPFSAGQSSTALFFFPANRNADTFINDGIRGKQQRQPRLQLFVVRESNALFGQEVLVHENLSVSLPAAGAVNPESGKAADQASFNTMDAAQIPVSSAQTVECGGPFT